MCRWLWSKKITEKSIRKWFIKWTQLFSAKLIGFSASRSVGMLYSLQNLPFSPDFAHFAIETTTAKTRRKFSCESKHYKNNINCILFGWVAKVQKIGDKTCSALFSINSKHNKQTENVQTCKKYAGNTHRWSSKREHCTRSSNSNKSLVATLSRSSVFGLVGERNNGALFNGWSDCTVPVVHAVIDWRLRKKNKKRKKKFHFNLKITNHKLHELI